MRGIDVVALYTQKFVQLFPSAKIMHANIRQRSQVMEHPLETGSIIIDHSIILPTEIDLSIILESADYKNVYAQINQYFQARTLVLVQTRAGVYENQIIMEIPHEENSEMINAIIMGIKLKEVQIEGGTTGNFVQNPANSNTVSRGQQNSSSIPSSNSVNTSLQ
jgi:hypothetical protein